MKKRMLVLVAMLLVATSLLVACGGRSKKLTPPENVRYDGVAITWNAVDNADCYEVQINDGDAWEVTTTRYPYNAAGAEFTVKVSAVIEGKKNVVSEATVMNFKPLDKVSEIRVADDGSLSWDVVNNANGYLIKIDGVEVNAPVELPAYNAVPVGQHSVQVRAIVQGDNSYYSTWSNAKSLNVLGTPTLNDITYANGYIRWNVVSGAQNYIVSVNGVPLAEKVTGTSVLYDPQNEDFEVSVQAIGNHSTTFDGKVSEIKKFIFLDTVTNLQVSDGILTWDPINGATGYKIKLNGNELPQVFTECKYTELSANANTRVQVMPVSNDTAYFSTWCAEKSVLILPAPVVMWNADIALDGDANSNFTWNSVANASGYAVRLTKPDGTQIVSTFGETQRFFQEAYLDTGVYLVEVKALAATASSNVYDSKYAPAVKVVRLDAPKAADTNYIVSNPSDLDEGFVVTFKQVAGAMQYKLYKDNNEHMTIASSANQFAVKNIALAGVIEEQTYNFKIQSIGTVRVENGQTVATLSSLSANSLSFSVTVLAAPLNPSISGYTYSYSSVSKALGYTVDVQGQSFDSGETYYDLSVLKAGNYRVSVCAKGNGSTVLPSAYSAAINVYRLEAPTNVRIDTTDASEGVLGFDEVPYAQSYYIVFNNDGNALPVNTIGNMNQYVTEQGTTVYMQSSANYFNTDKTVYYMTSQPGPTSTFVKLAAPQFGDVAFTGTNLVWNAPKNMNTQIYTPTYEVYNNSDIKYNGEKNGTAMDLSFLKGGQRYEFRVKAIGDGKNYINSEKSTVVSIYKLATPVVTRSNGQYTWSGVSSAQSYAVYVDGKLVATFQHAAGQTYAYTPTTFTELKDYRVEVVAVGDNGYTSLNSSAFTLVQKTAQLQTPDFALSYSEAYYTQGGKVIVTLTKTSPNAKGYVYRIGGTDHEVTEGDVTRFEYNPNGVGKIVVGVYAMGGSFDADGVYYLESQFAGGSDRYSIDILAYPSTITVDMDGMLSWTSIAGAIGYEVEITIDGGETVTMRVNGNGMTIDGFANAHTVTVKIRALGNGSTSVSSEQITKTFNVSV